MKRYEGYLRIGIDVDGCMSSFVDEFSRLLCHIEGINYPEHFSPTSFYWYDELGVSKKTVAEGWETIKNDPSFWEQLHPTPNGVDDLVILDNMAWNGHDIYFITARPYKGAKLATENWLRKFGIRHPTVLICDQKGPAARSLKLTHFLDDKVDNCYDVLRHCGTRCNVYLLDRSYNNKFHDIYVPKVQSFQSIFMKEKLNEVNGS